MPGAWSSSDFCSLHDHSPSSEPAATLLAEVLRQAADGAKKQMSHILLRELFNTTLGRVEVWVWRLQSER